MDRSAGMASLATVGNPANTPGNTRPDAVQMDSNMTAPDSPSSTLSDYPDNLTESSEAKKAPLIVDQSVPAGNFEVAQFPTAPPETPKTGPKPSSQRGLLTPPNSLGNSGSTGNHALFLSQATNTDMAPASRSNARRSSAKVPPTTPRRSTRKPPAQCSPVPPTPKKTKAHSRLQMSDSLVVSLRANPEALARIGGASAGGLFSPQYHYQQITPKRKQLDDNVSSEEPAPQRLRVKPSALPTQAPSLPSSLSTLHGQPPRTPPHGPNHAFSMLKLLGTPWSDPFASGQEVQVPPYGISSGLQGHDSQQSQLQQHSSSDAESEQNEVISPISQRTGANTSGLYALSTALKAGSTNLEKPEPSSQPEVWATSRAELCESVHYFRAYKGASQAKDGVQKSFMFSSIAHARDYTDASVVISRAGGGLEHDARTGEMSQQSDQKCARNDPALKNSMKQLNPVIIIIDETNPSMPSKVPHKYCVLDFFKPTDIWSEKSKGKVFWRYRFEKFNSTKSSWWQPKGASEIAPPGSLPPPLVQTCSVCNVDSEQLYLQGWMCLKHECSSFWKIRSESGNLQEPDEDSLLYDPRFLKKRTPWGNEDHHYSLTSDVAQISGHAVVGEDCSRAQWCGLVCPNCGRCCRRLDWTGWKCLNENCTFVKDAPHTLVPAATLRDPFDPLQPSYTNSLDSWGDDISCNIQFAFNYRIHRYTVLGIDGYITHLVANQTIVEEPGGPDDMFEELQRVDIGLQRRMMAKDFHTRHFSVNYGMPYKFIAKTASLPFEGAAKTITDSRSRMNWAAKLALAQYRGQTIKQVSEDWKGVEFNEVLALGYMEDQRINYHDDGEYGLGPTIATLSLGATGNMRIRMKAKHYNGVSKSMILTADPPIPGCKKYKERRAMQPMLEDLKLRDKNAYKLQAKAVPRELGLSDRPTPPDVLNMTVRHGDMVIMHGSDLQKYYEHSVDHKGKLRFALTCRYIDPNSLKPHEKPDGEIAPDPGFYDGTKLPLPPTSQSFFKSTFGMGLRENSTSF